MWIDYLIIISVFKLSECNYPDLQRIYIYKRMINYEIEAEIVTDLDVNKVECSGKCIKDETNRKIWSKLFQNISVYIKHNLTLFQLDFTVNFTNIRYNEPESYKVLLFQQNGTIELNEISDDITSVLDDVDMKKDYYYMKCLSYVTQSKETLRYYCSEFAVKSGLKYVIDVLEIPKSHRTDSISLKWNIDNNTHDGFLAVLEHRGEPIEEIVFGENSNSSIKSRYICKRKNKSDENIVTFSNLIPFENYNINLYEIESSTLNDAGFLRFRTLYTTTPNRSGIVAMNLFIPFAILLVTLAVFLYKQYKSYKMKQYKRKLVEEKFQSRLDESTKENVNLEYSFKNPTQHEQVLVYQTTQNDSSSSGI